MDPRSRLYLEDPSLLQFEAEVLEVRPLPDGDVGVLLDRTAFYPTSGGQPHDTGMLGGETVLDVIETDDDRILHRLHRAPADKHVQGTIDAVRRRDHMQQHSGQHLLSATCVALAGRQTLSFHLGAERCSIDLPGPLFDAATLDAIEQRANAIIWEGRPVRAHLLTAEAAGDLRKSLPAGAETVRVIEIEGWDRNACCGTHVRRTSEIGMVKLLGQERAGSGTRLHFACGFRALAACGADRARIDALVRLLTCHPDEIEARCEKLVADSKAAKKEHDNLQAALAASQAREALAVAPRPGGVPVVVRLQEASGVGLREMATALVEAGAVALLGRAGERAELLFAAPDGVTLDLRPALKAACESIEGKGGGPPGRVQAAGPRIDGLEAALEAARFDVVGRLTESR